jgi:hypothetical protein
MKPPATVAPDGTPTDTNPTLSVAGSRPAPLGVPSFMIDQFTIPPFLVPIYQACGTQYGIPWEVLAGINRIETAFGTNLNVSTAGAVGWMQFIPSTWKAYGVDANGDGTKDPYNPVDAICAAARYLKAAGGNNDLRRAIFSYNHADWYVDEVLLYARQYGRLPEDLVGSITGLTEGDRFPVAAKSRYADDLSQREAAKRAKPGNGSGNVADVVSSSPTRRGINIYSHEGAPVVAVNDGTIKRIGHNSKLGNYVVLQDNFGNQFTYAQLGSLAKVYPVPRKQTLTAADFKLANPAKHARSPHQDKRPTQPASAGTPKPGTAAAATSGSGPVNTEDLRQRTYALPQRSHNVERAGLSGQLDQLMTHHFPAYQTVKSYFGGILHMNHKTMALRPLGKGAKVSAGTVLGRIGPGDALAPHVNFSIRPTGKGAPKIDPKPILDGWKLLEDTAIYRAAGEDPFKSGTGRSSIAQTLLMPKSAVERRVLADPRLSIYPCGRNDISTGQVDRRVLATMEYLTDNGFRLTIGSLKCGYSDLTSSGTATQRQEHKAGSAVGISKINGIPVVGNQGSGTLTDDLVKTTLNLQGTLEPDEVVSREDLPGPVSFSPSDAPDYIDIGFAPLSGSGYQNPFDNAVEGRIDMGVDFTGSGAIRAIGTSRILAIGASGWPNGGAGPAGQGVLYKLLTGPRAGDIIYVYEGLRPTVHAGDLVAAGQQIATFYPGSSIEIGLADAAGAPLAHDVYTEGMVTGWGRKMAAFLASIGVPSQHAIDHRFSQLLEPGKWNRVIDRIGHIHNPTVPTSPSRFAIPAGKQGSHGAKGH